MKKRIVIHIGYSKCGSTTIQETLKAHHELLLKEGFLFPVVVADNPSWMRFFWEKELPISYDAALLKYRKLTFLKKLEQEVNNNNAHTVIVSDEGLISLCDSSVEDMKQYFSRVFSGYDIHVVAIVREPLAFFASRCQQYLAERYFTQHDIDEFLEGRDIINGESRADNIAMNPATIFSVNLSRYRSAFGNVTIVKFEDAIEHTEGFTSYFLKKMDCDVNVVDVLNNSGKSDKSIDIVSYINRRVPFIEKGKRNPLRFHNDLKLLFKISGNKYRLNTPQINALRTRTHTEVLWLKESAGIDYTKSEVAASDEAIVWDDTFCTDMTAIFPMLGKIHQHLIYEFISERLLQVSDSQSNTALTNTRKIMEQDFSILNRLDVNRLLWLFKVRQLSKRFVQVVNWRVRLFIAVLARSMPG